MATPTYDPIASTTLTSSASSVTFSSLNTIAAGYRDLIVVISYSGADTFGVNTYFNGDSTTSNYSRVWMLGNGSTTTSGSSASSATIFSLYANNTNVILQIMDFSATDKHKSSLVRLNAPDNSVWGQAARWANTSAITQISFNGIGVNFPSGTTFSLFGIVA